MTIRFTPVPSLLIALTLLLPTARAGADPASAFFQARQAVSGSVLTGAQGLDAVHHPGGYEGRTLGGYGMWFDGL